MRLIIRCALCMKKEQLPFNFWYCASWCRKYGTSENLLITPCLLHPLLEKNVFPPGLEPRTFRVLGERDNHYTTETTDNDSEFICIISETAMVQYLRHAKIESFWSGSHILRPYPCIRNLKYKLWRPPINKNPVYCARCQVAGWPNRHV